MRSFESKRPKRVAGTWRTNESYLFSKIEAKIAQLVMLTFAHCSLDVYFMFFRLLMNVGCQLIITEFQSSLILIFGESMRIVKAISPFAGDTSKSKKRSWVSRETAKNSIWTFKICFIAYVYWKKFFQDPWCDPENPKIIRFEGE